MADMRPAEVAAVLGVHLETVKKLLRSGELRGFRVGRLWRITPEAVAEFRTTVAERFNPPGDTGKRPPGRPRKRIIEEE